MVPVGSHRRHQQGGQDGGLAGAEVRQQDALTPVTGAPLTERRMRRAAQIRGRDCPS